MARPKNPVGSRSIRGILTAPRKEKRERRIVQAEKELEKWTPRTADAFGTIGPLALFDRKKLILRIARLRKRDARHALRMIKEGRRRRKRV